MATALDATLLALADPTRRRIFEVLLAGATRVAEIADAVGVKGDDLCEHLATMEAAGLVVRQGEDGGTITADPAPLDIAAEWINTNRELWTMRSQMQSVSVEPAPGEAQ
ncbi:DNA-binding transcriptional ArsR family regulator [Sinorhizobium terangae]|uniref:Helix-turn-helix domain-containing protein n=1 Tax=Sinorhizobium terangae TaxID=110322 RepID=A0A6N7L997_SINTE|nr:helix-turn-helix domain-containing protein [Sinorhizobium terangae]MBB4185174.1 DNA-binding transcriptional ArsR family regulator [Sinorhizobium terangae]MQX13779.1 helix-turn-helix domain-containing protein [Sinorhizobium terangae]